MLFLMHHQDGPLLQRSSPDSDPSHPGQDLCASPQNPLTATAPSSEEREEHHALLEKIEAERDDSQTKGQASLSQDNVPSSNARWDGKGQRESGVGGKDGEGMQSTGDSTTIWSSLELDMNDGHSYKGDSCACDGPDPTLFLFLK